MLLARGENERMFGLRSSRRAQRPIHITFAADDLGHLFRVLEALRSREVVNIRTWFQGRIRSAMLAKSIDHGIVMVTFLEPPSIFGRPETANL